MHLRITCEKGHMQIETGNKIAQYCYSHILKVKQLQYVGQEVLKIQGGKYFDKRLLMMRVQS